MPEGCETMVTTESKKCNHNLLYYEFLSDKLFKFDLAAIRMTIF